MSRTSLQGAVVSGYDRTLQRIADGLPTPYKGNTLPRLPADQRELCIGVAFEYEAHERWERIAAS